MAIFYVKKQNVRKGGNQLWYGRAIHPTSVNLDDVAERIQRNTSLTKGDCVGILAQAIQVMNEQIAQGNKILLDGLGYIYASLKTTGAVSEEEFTPSKNVKQINIKFLPVRQRSADGSTTRALTEGATFKYAGA